MSAERRRFGLTLAEAEAAMAQGAVDRDILLAAIRKEEARIVLAKREQYEGFLSGWTGLVVDERTDETLAEVHGWTKRRMQRRREVAFLAQVDRLAAERRAES